MSIRDMLLDKAASASAIVVEFAREGGPDIASLERREDEDTLAGESARVGLMLALDRSDVASDTAEVDDAWLRSMGGLDAILPMLLPVEGNAGTGGGGFLDDEGNTARRSVWLRL